MRPILHHLAEGLIVGALIAALVAGSFWWGRVVEAQAWADARAAEELAGRGLCGSFRLQLDECTVGALSRTRPATRFTNWTLTPTPPEPMAAHRSKP